MGTIVRLLKSFLTLKMLHHVVSASKILTFRGQCDTALKGVYNTVRASYIRIMFMFKLSIFTSFFFIDDKSIAWCPFLLSIPVHNVFQEIQQRKAWFTICTQHFLKTASLSRFKHDTCAKLHCTLNICNYRANVFHYSSGTFARKSVNHL